MTLNKNHVNAVIKANILSDEEMRKIGFTDCNNKRWYFGRHLKLHEISFNVSINKENPLDLRIDILDEDFSQPYDYQTILKKNPENEVALEVEVNVEKYMKYLQNCGVLSGHIEGEYI